MLVEIELQAGGARAKNAERFIKCVDRYFLAAVRRFDRELDRNTRFARARRTGKKRGCSARQAASEQLVHLLNPAGNVLVGEIAMMFRGDQPRENCQAPAFDHEIVIATAI